jgi:hypothetical protein
MAKKISRNQVIKVLTFAQENKCFINPMGYGYYLEGFTEFGHCVCDKKRLSCPCEQAAGEIEVNGRCLCQLYWRDYGTYLEQKFNVGKEKK